VQPPGSSIMLRGQARLLALAVGVVQRRSASRERALEPSYWREATGAMVIRFFASIRTITGVKEIEWSEPTLTLGELLRLLSDRYGPEFRRWALDGEVLGNSVMVVINGDDARHRGGVETRLVSTDVVSILPFMAGGTLRAVSSQQSAVSKNTTVHEAPPSFSKL
jgi:molybdopterin synthase sulfur carrier subunit